MARLMLDDGVRAEKVRLLHDNSGSMAPYNRRSAALNASAAAIKVFRLAEREQEHLAEKTTLKDVRTFQISVSLLNGVTEKDRVLDKELHVDDVVGLTDSNYCCDGGTPLFRRFIEELRELEASVMSHRATGEKARGHLVVTSDGEAGDESAESLREARALVGRLIQPKQANGERADQLFSIYAVCIGKDARTFFEKVGIPSDHIIDVPDDAPDQLTKLLTEAMRRVSLVVSTHGALPIADPNPAPASLPEAGDQGDEDDEEMGGDLLIKWCDAERARKKASSVRLEWIPKDS